EIVTSAQGEAQYTPDRAHIYIGVQTRTKSAQEAGAENARKQEAVIAAIQALGIPKERISTANYNVYPEQQYNPQQGDKEPRIVGYHVTNTVRVDIHDISKVGASSTRHFPRGRTTSTRSISTPPTRTPLVARRWPRQ